MGEKISIVPLLLAAIAALATAVTILWKYITKKDKHLSMLTEKVTEAMVKVDITIQRNTEVIKSTGESTTRAIDRCTDMYNDLHKDILRATRE